MASLVESMSAKERMELVRFLEPFFRDRDRQNCCGWKPPKPGDYAAAVRALTDLRGYWRLGEGATPYADTSGYNATHPANLSRHIASGHTAMTQDVTPGLLLPPVDDGAVAFNETGDDSGTGVAGDYLESTDANARANFNFDSSHKTMTIIARVKPFVTSSSFYGTVFSFMNTSVVNGWGLSVRFPTGEVFFTRYTSGGGEQSNFAAGGVIGPDSFSIGATYDGSVSQLYVNGVAVGSPFADANNLTTVTSSSLISVRIGGGQVIHDPSGGGFFEPFYGVVDEVAVWGSVLSAADILALHMDADLAASAGEVLSLNDDGSVSWDFPTVEVDY